MTTRQSITNELGSPGMYLTDSMAEKRYLIIVAEVHMLELYSSDLQTPYRSRCPCISSTSKAHLFPAHSRPLSALCLVMAQIVMLIQSQL